MNVYDLQAKIGLDSSGYEAGLKSAGDQGKAFGEKLSGLMSSVANTVAATLEKAASETTKFLADSVKVGADFDSAMSQVAATMGTTADQITELRDFAQEMGASTQFSATQAAEALNYMALAGYDAETSMEMLPNVLNLAAAGGMELARASDMVTDTQSAFGISLSRTKQMVDEMAKAASTGNTNVEQLGDAFLTVGALAQELNGGFVTLAGGTKANADGIQELEIALTMMANAGIKGSEAGTHMRNMLLKLADQTPEGAQAFTDLGVAVYDSAGQMRSLKDIFGDMNTAMSRLTQQDKLQKISAIFNTRDTASAEAIMNAMAQDWDRIGAAILDANGAASAMAETQLDNLAGDVTILKSAWEGVQIAVSDLVSPQLRTGVQFITNTLSNLTNALRGNGRGGIEAVWDNAIGKIRTKIAEFVTYDLPELPGKIWDVLGKIGDKIAAEANSWKWIGEQAGKTIINGMTELSTKSDQIIPFLTNFAERFSDPEPIKKIVGIADTIISNLIDGLLSDESIEAFLEGVPKVISNLADGFMTVLAGEEHDGQGGLVGAATKIVDKISKYLSSKENRQRIYAASREILTTLGETLLECADVLLPFIGQLGLAIANGIWESVTDELAWVFHPEWWGDGMHFNASQATLDAYNESGTTLQLPEWLSLQSELNAIKAGNGSYEGLNYDEEAQKMLAYAEANGLNVPHFAEGAIVTKPTYALIGEAGTEAVVPLEKGFPQGQSVTIQFGDIYVTGGAQEIGREIVRQIDTALRSYQIQQARGIGGTAWT